MNDQIIKIDGLYKQYKYGKIGFTTFQNALKDWWERTTNPQERSRRAADPEFFYALEDINLTINTGEKVGIIGKNGAGKSTLLKLISRITSPTSGQIELFGRVASLLEVGTGFDGELTGRENIYLNGSILGMSRDEIDTKMDDIIAFSEVSDFIDTPVKKYSSGMRVKLGFAVAAYLDNEILIMDEPTKGIDVMAKRDIYKLVNDLAEQGKAVLFLSSYLPEMLNFCDRIIVLNDGAVVGEFPSTGEEAEINITHAMLGGKVK